MVPLPQKHAFQGKLSHTHSIHIISILSVLLSYITITQKYINSRPDEKQMIIEFNR